MTALLPDRIDSHRLRLRTWQHADAAALNTIVRESMDHLRPWMAWIAAEPLTLSERVALIEGWLKAWEEGGDAHYGVFLDGQPIGSCGLHHRSGPGSIEIGYWVRVEHTHQGYATELTAALTNAALQHGFATVHVVTDEANTTSAAVPQRLGFDLARIERREPTTASETGRMQVWVRSTPVVFEVRVDDSSA